MQTKQRKSNFFLSLIIFLIPWAIAIFAIQKFNAEDPNVESKIKIINFKKDTVAKADHSKFEILQQEFVEPQQLTAACLTCHNNTDTEVMQSVHWKWSRPTTTKDGKVVEFGKRNSINNFCVGISSNWARCTSCHAGYGWKNNSFDFTEAQNIDCIVCHDRTGTYKKFPTMAGMPVKEKKIFMKKKTFLPPNYNEIAYNVGKPTKKNCGSCHFTGGGGNNVKHGDLEIALLKADKNVDVHMGHDGQNMDCIDCHVTEQHNISGKLYAVSSKNENRVTCQQCHTEAPHKDELKNEHTQKIACQTCHIPTYAKVNPTKMNWDWSTAGELDAKGKPVVKKDENGIMTYHGKKGTFIWKSNVEPEYFWFNGTVGHYFAGEKVEDLSKPLDLNPLNGSFADGKIYPVKVHRGKQIFDPVTKMVIIPQLFGKNKEAYWKSYDWDMASAAGMKSAGLPYSGKYEFIETDMNWPVNHMVSTKDKALQCADCHSREGRLANVAGFYMPGRDKSGPLDTFGFMLMILTMVGVLGHGLIRFIKK